MTANYTNNDSTTNSPNQPTLSPQSPQVVIKLNDQPAVGLDDATVPNMPVTNRS